MVVSSFLSLVAQLGFSPKRRENRIKEKIWARQSYGPFKPNAKRTKPTYFWLMHVPFYTNIVIREENGNNIMKIHKIK